MALGRLIELVGEARVVEPRRLAELVRGTWSVGFGFCWGAELSVEGAGGARTVMDICLMALRRSSMMF